MEAIYFLIISSNKKGDKYFMAWIILPDSVSSPLERNSLFSEGCHSDEFSNSYFSLIFHQFFSDFSLKKFHFPDAFPLSLLCSNSHNDVPPAPQRKVSMAVVSIPYHSIPENFICDTVIYLSIWIIILFINSFFLMQMINSNIGWWNGKEFHVSIQI